MDRKYRRNEKLLDWENKPSELISKKRKKVSTPLSYMEHLHIMASVVTWCVPTLLFASLVGSPIGVASFAVGLKTCVAIASNKKYKLIIKKDEETWFNSIVLLAKI